MIALAITGAITLVCLAGLASGARVGRANAAAIIRATEVAFSTDATPSAARDAALLYLKERSK